MNNKYYEIKPITYIFDYDNLFKILKEREITLGQLQKELDLSKEEINKIISSQFSGSILKIAEYLGVSHTKLFHMKGKYDLFESTDYWKWCDELINAGYTIEYCSLSNGFYEFKMSKMGSYPITTKSSSFSIAIGDLHDKYKYYKENEYYPTEFE